MVRFKVRVEVWLKEGLVDAEGETVEESLRDLGYMVDSVRVGKIYKFNVEAESVEEARDLVEEICARLLTNPVKDTYLYEVEPP